MVERRFAANCTAAILISVSAYAGAPANATTFSTLHKFCSKPNCADGGNPLQSPLLPDGAGNYFGTAQNGGANNGGTLYELIGGTKYRKVFDFPGNGEPRGPLVQDAQGNLYGIEGSGANGAGGIFKLVRDTTGKKWTYENLYTFCAGGGACADGQAPVELTYVGAASGAPYDPAAPLYGSTIFGGATGAGSVFQLSRKNNGQWQEKVLHSFCSKTNCTDGMWPSYGLIAETSGNLYGTTSAGGNTNNGVTFKLSSRPGSKKWKETVLYTFCNDSSCTDGSQPYGLVEDANANLYGTTLTGGDAAGGLSGGVIYRLAPAGKGYRYTRLYSFCQQSSCADGDGPQTAMVLDSAGVLYGTTAGDSRVFSFVPATSTYQVLHSFCTKPNCRDGVMPLSPLTLDGAGHLFGNTNNGGSDLLGGTLFRIAP